MLQAVVFLTMPVKSWCLVLRLRACLSPCSFFSSGFQGLGFRVLARFRRLVIDSGLDVKTDADACLDPGFRRGISSFAN